MAVFSEWKFPIWRYGANALVTFGYDGRFWEETGLVKKSDAETNFYYMGLFDVVDAKADKKRDNNGRERDITKVKMRMRHAVRDDLLRYLQSSIK